MSDHPSKAMSQLAQLFQNRLGSEGAIAALQASQIGHDVQIDGPFGPRRLVYCDYVASGRALRAVEDVILNDVLPYYANSHTEASYCGAYMTLLRREARQIIASACNADDDFAVIFAGSGATAGINRLVHLFGLDLSDGDPTQALVVIGPYEHHSNILPWRESGAIVVEIAEAEGGGPDLAHLDRVLTEHADKPLKIGSFSAASNITGVLTDPVPVTRLLKKHGARVIWDYAGGAPYLPISMRAAPGLDLDAVIVSPHKFVGGPGASGVLIVRRAAVAVTRPTWPGGGTVRFAAPAFHDYSLMLEAREEAGTPNVLGDLRAALAFLAKQAVGVDTIAKRNAELLAKALGFFKGHPSIELLGALEVPRLPFLSFRVRDGKGGYHHHQLVTRLLSDLYGIQARGGCACAGPYVHRLLGIDPQASAALRDQIMAGDELSKPGFIRLNLSYLLDDEEVEFILQSVSEIASDYEAHAGEYKVDAARAIFRHGLTQAA
ncbi:MAG: aminotransferase class V-fold PLP-dependent enzyme [Albidovulum sp.]